MDLIAINGEHTFDRTTSPRLNIATRSNLSSHYSRTTFIPLNRIYTIVNDRPDYTDKFLPFFLSLSLSLSFFPFFFLSFRRTWTVEARSRYNDCSLLNISRGKQFPSKWNSIATRMKYPTAQSKDNDCSTWRIKCFTPSIRLICSDKCRWGSLA